MSKENKFLNFFKEWIIPALIGCAVAIALKFFVFDVIVIDGESMEPNFHDNEVVISQKVSKNYEIGDTIILTITEGYQNGGFLEHKKLIKRIVGLEGDTIEVKDGILIRNGKEVKEPYINEKMEEDFDEYTVPKGKVFVMGDNRNNSSDSRIIGAIDKKDINGIVLFHSLEK